MQVYYDKDCDLSIIQGKKVAIIVIAPAGIWCDFTARRHIDQGVERQLPAALIKPTKNT